MHNAIQCNIDFDDEHDNEIAPGDVAVISSLKNRVDFNGTLGLVRVFIPSKQRWGVRCAGQVLDVAIAAKNLVRVTAKGVGGSLRAVQHRARRGVCRAGLLEPSFGIRGRSRR